LTVPGDNTTARQRRQVRKLRQQLTEHQRVESAVRASESTFRELVHRANCIILRWDPEGRIIFLNDYGQRFFGYSNDEVIGRSVLGLIVPDTESSGRDLVAMIEDLLRHPERYASNENENMRRDGERVWITWRNTPIVNAEGRLVEIVSTGIDTTERKRADDALRASEERFRELSVRDNLTGLYNTRHLYAALGDLIARNEPFSVVFVDLDRFKRVVDGYGHLNGSRAIQEVADTIRSCVSPPAWAVAYAGDEFVIVLPQARRDAALGAAEELRARIAATSYLAATGRPARLTASFGIACHPDDATDLAGLLGLADRALFDVKSSGRNGIATRPKGGASRPAR